MISQRETGYHTVMRYSIIIQTLVNSQPEHVFVAEHGVREGSVDDLYRRHVQEQFDRLERGRPDRYLLDNGYSERGAVMSRAFGNSVTTVHVFVTDAQAARPYFEAQERVRKG